MADPFTDAAGAIKLIFDAEFAAEGFSLGYDELHESLPLTANSEPAVAGIAPTEQRPAFDRLVQDTYVEVRLQLPYPDARDPHTVIDPRTITAYADRLKRRLGSGDRARVGDSDIWYFDVDATQYPRDPTGNKTRFVMTIRCKGQNTNLRETLG